jgi:uncharacterized protein
MRRSTKLFLFPDLNVWIALTYRGHIHHAAATAWLQSLPDDVLLCFCRITQLGFLRLLTTPAVMGNKVLGQTEAWEVYDEWLENGNAMFLDEPPALELALRSFFRSTQAAPKDWSDSYVAAFSRNSGSRLVTFDQALHRRTSGSILLQSE